MYQSTKVMDGYSACFRQWKADGTHCKFLHGYGIYFTLIFEGELDERNWVWDFGGMKRAINKIDGRSPKEWFDYMFDHTTILAQDDPERFTFVELHNKGIIQLRSLPAVGCEKFAEYVYNKVNEFLKLETNGRVKLASVTCHEHAKNSAIYKL